uniref:Uncharacterized protein n=1 Tax=Arundo donax TaxID=35708 RepID=A0A0A9GPV8_ARUDO
MIRPRIPLLVNVLWSTVWPNAPLQRQLKWREIVQEIQSFFFISFLPQWKMPLYSSPRRS